MDVTGSADLDEFRRAARVWLTEHASPRRSASTSWGAGSDNVAVFHDRTDEAETIAVEAARAWHRTKLSAGWAGLTLAETIGGRGLSPDHEQTFADEEAAFEVPAPPELLQITVGLVAPTIDLLGTEDQRDRFARSFLAADELCCQLFSEPDAGSDLAGVRCQLRHDGDRWVVNGQKIWTSGARQADFGLLIGRSDAEAPKHRGMTALLVPLDAPGIEIRPIRQITGGASFNEVYFDDVEIPDSLRIGAPGDGWTVALTVLGFERSVSGAGAGGVGGSWDQVHALAEHVGDLDAVDRQELAGLYTRARLLGWLNDRAKADTDAGSQPTAVGSIAKLFWVQTMTHTSQVVSLLLGPRLVANTGEWGTYAWTEHVLGTPGYRIAGGSDEIQRNIIAERILGLPRDPR
jgi:alkylation response protein AidB-like acyl-CoA dehydrogenase